MDVILLPDVLNQTMSKITYNMEYQHIRLLIKIIRVKLFNVQYRKEIGSELSPPHGSNQQGCDGKQ